MIIGYDGKRAVCNNTGLGNYSRFAIGAMAKAYPGNTHIAYSPKMVPNSRFSCLEELRNVKLELPDSTIGKKLGGMWRSFGITHLLKRDKADIYHGLSNELPLNIRKAGIPSVVTIHDLIWRRIPADYPAVDRLLDDYKYSRAARNATRIIAISERTKADIVSDFGIAPEKIDIVYQGCDPIFHKLPAPEEIAAVREKYGLPETYIAGVGTVQGRKNQLLAVKALRSMPTEIKLAIVGGQQKSYADKIRRYISEHGLADRVIWIGRVDFADLPALYAGAACTSYPSRYEGFGLPVAESILCGTPVVAATGSCLEEAGGPGAFYIDPDDDEAFAHCAMRIISDSALRSKMAAEGLKHVLRFDNADFARSTMAVYERAINEF